MSELAGCLAALQRRPALARLRKWGNLRTHRLGPVIAVVVGALAGFVAAFLALQPVRAFGELPEDELSTNQNLCNNCRPSERILAAGYQAINGTGYVTVRLRGAPSNSVISMAFPGHSDRLVLAQRTNVWTTSTPTPTSIPVNGYSIAVRGQTIVLALPTGFVPSGVQVLTDKDSFPTAGRFISQAAHPHSLNIADLVVVVCAAFGGWLGYRRGLILELGRLIAVVAVLVLTFLLFVPIQDLLRGGIHNRQLLGALTYGFVLATLGCGAYLLGWYIQRRFGAPQLPISWRGSRVDKIAGLVAGAIRIAVIAAAIMSFILTLASLSVAATWIDQSLIGNSIASLWTRVFPVCVCS